MEQEIQYIHSMLTDPYFIRTHWMQSPKVFKAQEYLEQVYNQHTLETWVELHATLYPDTICFLNNGQKQDAEKIFSLQNNPRLVEQIMKLANRQTVCLYNYYRSNKFYRKLVWQLAQSFDADGSAGLFVSLRKTGGLQKHKDMLQMFVFQHTGSCIWVIYSREDDTKIVFEHELVPGEVLYIPYAFPHEALRTCPRESHVSSGFSYRERNNLYRALATNPVLQNAFADRPSLRQEIKKLAALEGR